MRADTMGGNFAAVYQSLAFERVHAKQAAARIGGVVLGCVQPIAAFVNDRMAIKVAMGVRRDGLKERAITQVDQVTFGARATGDEQRNRQRRVVDDVVAALA